LAKPLRLHALR
jgi:hypothetical protein